MRIFRKDGKPVDSMALIGMGPSMQAYLSALITQDRTEPLADEVWAINLAPMALRCDRIVWMDDLEEQNKLFGFSIRRLAELDVPVITSIGYPDLVPKSESYPINEVAIRSLQLFGRIYLNNSVAYGVALAHTFGVRSIKLYGCDFTYPNWNHAEKGRACVEAWLTAHVLKGGHVDLPDSTSLFDQAHGSALYGYVKQPEVVLPDGSILRHVETPNGGNHVFIPPDTSGVTNAESAADGPVPGSVPGAEGSGAGRDAGEQVPGGEAGSDDPSGEGLRGPGAGGVDGERPAAVSGRGVRKGRVRPEQPEEQAGIGDGAGLAA